MSKKIEITEKQAAQFNRMWTTLTRIKRYQSPGRLRKTSERLWGCDFEEAIEMAYENIQGEAAQAVRGIKKLELCTASTTPIE